MASDETFHDYTLATHLERFVAVCEQTLTTWKRAGFANITRKGYNARIKEQPALVKTQASLRHKLPFRREQYMLNLFLPTALVAVAPHAGARGVSNRALPAAAGAPSSAAALAAGSPGAAAAAGAPSAAAASTSAAAAGTSSADPTTPARAHAAAGPPSHTYIGGGHAGGGGGGVATVSVPVTPEKLSAILDSAAQSPSTLSPNGTASGGIRAGGVSSGGGGTFVRPPGGSPMAGKASLASHPLTLDDGAGGGAASTAPCTPAKQQLPSLQGGVDGQGAAQAQAAAAAAAPEGQGPAAPEPGWQVGVDLDMSDLMTRINTIMEGQGEEEGGGTSDSAAASDSDAPVGASSSMVSTSGNANATASAGTATAGNMRGASSASGGAAKAGAPTNSVGGVQPGAAVPQPGEAGGATASHQQTAATATTSTTSATTPTDNNNNIIVASANAKAASGAAHAAAPSAPPPSSLASRGDDATGAGALVSWPHPDPRRPKGQWWRAAWQHKLQRWFGIDQFCLLHPTSFSRRILDEAEASTLLSCASLALGACHLTTPLLLPVHDALRDAYWGVSVVPCVGSAHLRTDSVHISSPPRALTTLPGQLRAFSEQLLPLSPAAAAACSAAADGSAGAGGGGAWPYRSGEGHAEERWEEEEAYGSDEYDAHRAASLGASTSAASYGSAARGNGAGIGLRLTACHAFVLPEPYDLVPSSPSYASAAPSPGHHDHHHITNHHHHHSPAAGYEHNGPDEYGRGEYRRDGEQDDATDVHAQYGAGASSPALHHDRYAALEDERRYSNPLRNPSDGARGSYELVQHRQAPPRAAHRAKSKGMGGDGDDNDEEEEWWRDHVVHGGSERKHSPGQRERGPGASVSRNYSHHHRSSASASSSAAGTPSHSASTKSHRHSHSHQHPHSQGAGAARGARRGGSGSGSGRAQDRRSGRRSERESFGSSVDAGADAGGGRGTESDDDEDDGLWDAGAAWKPWAQQIDPISVMEVDVVWEDVDVAAMGQAARQELQPSHATHWVLHALRVGSAPDDLSRSGISLALTTAERTRAHVQLQRAGADWLWNALSAEGWRRPGGQPPPTVTPVSASSQVGPGSCTVMLSSLLTARSVAADAHSIGDLLAPEWWHARGWRVPPLPPYSVMEEVLDDLLRPSNRRASRGASPSGTPHAAATTTTGANGTAVTDVPDGASIGADQWGAVQPEGAGDAAVGRLDYPRTAPLNSLLSRTALHCLVFGNARAIAWLWQRLVSELRFSYWEAGVPLPRMPGQPSETAPGGAPEPQQAKAEPAADVPDLSSCLLHQKLQVLDTCIRRQAEREAQRQAALRARAAEAEAEEAAEVFMSPGDERARASSSVQRVPLNGGAAAQQQPRARAGSNSTHQHSRTMSLGATSSVGSDVAVGAGAMDPNSSVSLTPAAADDEAEGFVLGSRTRRARGSRAAVAAAAGSGTGVGSPTSHAPVPTAAAASPQPTAAAGVTTAFESGFNSLAKLSVTAGSLGGAGSSFDPPASTTAAAGAAGAGAGCCAASAASANSMASAVSLGGRTSSSVGERELDGYYSADDDEHFAGQQPRGVAGVLAGACLRRHPERPLHIPITQRPPAWSEDRLAERQTTLAGLASNSIGSEVAWRLVSEPLASDMAAFKAANPGAVFTDFLRWHSPKDVLQQPKEARDGRLSAEGGADDAQIGMDGPIMGAKAAGGDAGTYDQQQQEVSTRMAAGASAMPGTLAAAAAAAATAGAGAAAGANTGGGSSSTTGAAAGGGGAAAAAAPTNPWHLLWDSTPACTAWDQKPLQDPSLEAERTLHELETLSPSALFDQLLATALASSARLLAASDGGRLAPLAGLVTQFHRISAPMLRRGCAGLHDSHHHSHHASAHPPSTPLGTHHGPGPGLSVAGWEGVELEYLLSEFHYLEQAVVLAESLCRRLPGCTPLAASLMSSTLQGNTSWEDGRTVYRPASWVDGPAGRRALAALLAGRLPPPVSAATAAGGTATAAVTAAVHEPPRAASAAVAAAPAAAAGAGEARTTIASSLHQQQQQQQQQQQEEQRQWVTGDHHHHHRHQRGSAQAASHRAPSASGTRVSGGSAPSAGARDATAGSSNANAHTNASAGSQLGLNEVEVEEARHRSRHLQRRFVEQCVPSWPPACSREWAVSVREPLQGSAVAWQQHQRHQHQHQYQHQHHQHQHQQAGSSHAGHNGASASGAAAAAAGGGITRGGPGSAPMTSVEHRMYVHAADGEMRVATVLWQTQP